MDSINFDGKAVNNAAPMPTSITTRGSDSRLPIGSNFCHCGVCGLYFRNVRAFDVHRLGPGPDRGCLPTPQLSSMGLEQDGTGYWRRPKRVFAGRAVRAAA
jgi:hypothetical protein